jgi:hypothetical protein
MQVSLEHEPNGLSIIFFYMQVTPDINQRQVSQANLNGYR